jgi:hypothetical protein
VFRQGIRNMVGGQHSDGGCAAGNPDNCSLGFQNGLSNQGNSSVFP